MFPKNIVDSFGNVFTGTTSKGRVAYLMEEKNFNTTERDGLHGAAIGGAFEIEVRRKED